MADNSTADPGAGGDTFRTKDRAGVKTEIVALDLAPGGSETLMNGVMPVSDNAGSLTVDAPVGTPAFVRLSDGAAAITALPVTDNAGSLTVDNAGTFAVQPAANSTVDVNRIAGTATDTNSGLKSAGTQRVVLATDQPQLTNALKVDGSAVTQPVSGTVTASGPLTDTQLRASAVPVDSELTTADLDTGAGTDTRAVVGLVIAKSGGAANVSNTDPVPISDAGGNISIDDGGNSITVDGTVTANAGTGPFPVSDNGGSLTVDNGGTFAVQIAANSSVNVAQVAGTTTDTNSGVKSAGTQRVVLATDQPALTNALKVDGSAVTQPVSGTVTASNATGSVAHDGVDSGNPVKVGSRARTSDVTAVAADDRTDAISDILGKQVTLPYALPAAAANGTANSTGTADTSVIAAPGAGVRLYITQLVVTNAHATVGTKVQIKSATTTTGYPRVYAAAAGGGAALTFPTPLRLGEALQFACVTTGADVDVSASGFSAAA
jgi:hypothetical protein